tara:strand:+ start:1560 stop:2525 length:966 start_codon:yes stop_codon:yes gene_type:complete
MIAVSIGDINGIGIQIIIKLWEKRRINNFILVTNFELFKKYLIKKNINIDLNLIDLQKKNINYKKNTFNIFNYKSFSNAENTFKSLQKCYELCKKNICIGIVTLPISKNIIINKIDKNFVGQTEYFKNIDKKKYANMLMIHKRLIVSPLTTHIPVKQITNRISQKLFLYNQILNIELTLRRDFNIKKPKLAISGLNPHSGENGNFGKEEIKIINPLIKNLKKRKILIDGPFSADSILLNDKMGKYDCFLFMYHDQALIPFKYISQFNGINYTGNLDIIRTSPDHGTAYDMVNKKNISYSAILNCFKLIKKIKNNRNIFYEA